MIKERLVRAERVLLYTLEFDLCVEHPFKHVVPFVKECRGTSGKVAPASWAERVP